MHEISEQVWAAPLRDSRNMTARTLGAALGDDPTLLVFLRHLG